MQPNQIQVDRSIDEIQKEFNPEGVASALEKILGTAPPIEFAEADAFIHFQQQCHQEIEEERRKRKEALAKIDALEQQNKNLARQLDENYKVIQYIRQRCPHIYEAANTLAASFRSTASHIRTKVDGYSLNEQQKRLAEQGFNTVLNEMAKAISFDVMEHYIRTNVLTKENADELQVKVLSRLDKLVNTFLENVEHNTVIANASKVFYKYSTEHVFFTRKAWHSHLRRISLLALDLAKGNYKGVEITEALVTEKIKDSLIRLLDVNDVKLREQEANSKSDD